MKIGVFGGTFDPVHQGHIELCKTAIDALGLDLLYVMPNGNPPHKEDRTDGIDRLNMVKIAFSDIDKVKISDYEIRKEAHSYTYETLTDFKKEHPDDEIYFLMGMDNLDYFPKWKHPEVICTLAKLVFFGRAGFEKTQEGAKAISELFGVKPILIAFDWDISSTEIRKELEQGTYIFHKLPFLVYQYIIRKGLYGCQSVGEYDSYEEDLKNYIEEKRFLHSIGVAVTAYRMAIRYDEDPKQAYFAGLLHDIAKRMPLDKQLDLCKKIELHPDEVAYPKMLHAPAGAGFVKKKYNIKEKKLLSGIRYHTMGHKDMTTFDKLIYMADYIEPCRNFSGVEELREATFSNLNTAIIKGIDTTILSLVEEHLKISPVLLEVRNDLLEREQKGR
ncbi:MAG: nicotinate (nicotinamide) nucleotide adenylyltransferase [Ruminococcaceae bacterium]|nr:nicotinate (nicotinamide) nucleotide adenylyltransferase [Oscillospiraceae bacterium]